MSLGIRTAKNPNKIINLYRTGSTTKTWRTAISDILNDVSSESDAFSNTTSRPGDKMFLLENNASTNVQDNIDLLMINDPDKFKNDVGTATPIKSFFENLSGSSNSFVKGAMSALKLAKGAVDIFNAANTTANGAETETSLQFTPWMADIKSWDGTYYPIRFSYSFSFTMGQYGLWNAREEVVKPAFNLIAPVFPQYIDALYSRGPVPNILNLATNLIGNLKNLDSEEDPTSGDAGWLTKVGNKLDKLLLSTYSNFVWDIEFGTMIKIKRCMMTNGVAEFSKETDQYGYPVSATVTLSFESTIPLALSADDPRHMAARFGK